MSRPSVLVLCSGGLKSAFLIALAKKEFDDVGLLFLDHGQDSAIRERQAVHDLAKHYQLENTVHTLVIRDVVPSGWPRFKLTLLLWYAILYAKKYSYHKVYFGPSLDDKREEATLQYLNELRRLLETIQPDYADRRGIKYDKIGVDAPLIKLTESRVILLGNSYRVPWELTWCCLKNQIHHCGICPRCIRRQQAFATANYLDMTKYKIPYLELQAKKRALKKGKQ